MLSWKINFFFFFYDNISIYVLIFNLLVYLILLNSIFLIFFFFNMNKVFVLFDLKILNHYNFFSMSIIFIFLSLAGMPPLLGFISKFLLVVLFFSKVHYFFITLFFIINLFMIYFYIQNLRFLIKKFSVNSYVVLNDINLNLFSNLNFLNFLNFFSFFIFENFLIVLANLCFF